MHVTLVKVEVKPEHIQDFISATKINHMASIREAGNRRFDILQSAGEPSIFMMYEAYASAAEAQAHKQTPHYLLWRETVAPWMASPRVGSPYFGLFPS